MYYSDGYGLLVWYIVYIFIKGVFVINMHLLAIYVLFTCFCSMYSYVKVLFNLILVHDKHSLDP